MSDDDYGEPVGSVDKRGGRGRTEGPREHGTDTLDHGVKGPKMTAMWRFPTLYKEYQLDVKERYHHARDALRERDLGTGTRLKLMVDKVRLLALRPFLTVSKVFFYFAVAGFVLGALALHRFTPIELPRFPADAFGRWSKAPVADSLEPGSGPGRNELIGDGDGDEIVDGRETFLEDAREHGIDWPEGLEGPLDRLLPRDPAIGLGEGELTTFVPPDTYNPRLDPDGSLLTSNVMTESAGVLVLDDLEVNLYNGKLVMEGTVKDVLGRSELAIEGDLNVGDRVEMATPYRVSGSGVLYRIEETTRAWGNGPTAIPVPRESDGYFGPAVPGTSSGQPVSLPAAPVDAMLVAFTALTAPSGQNSAVDVAMLPHPSGVALVTDQAGRNTDVSRGQDGLFVRWDQVGDGTTAPQPLYRSTGGVQSVLDTIQEWKGRGLDFHSDAVVSPAESAYIELLSQGLPQKTTNRFESTAKLNLAGQVTDFTPTHDSSSRSSRSSGGVEL